MADIALDLIDILNRQNGIIDRLSKSDENENSSVKRNIIKSPNSTFDSGNKGPSDSFIKKFSGILAKEILSTFSKSSVFNLKKEDKSTSILKKEIITEKILKDDNKSNDLLSKSNLTKLVESIAPSKITNLEKEEKPETKYKNLIDLFLKKYFIEYKKTIPDTKELGGVGKKEEKDSKSIGDLLEGFLGKQTKEGGEEKSSLIGKLFDFLLIRSGIKGFASILKSKVVSTLGKYIITPLSNLKTTISSKIGNALKPVSNVISSGAKAVKNTASSAMTSVKTSAGNLFSKISSKAGALVSSGKELGKSVISKGGQVVSGAKGLLDDAISKFGKMGVEPAKKLFGSLIEKSIASSGGIFKFLKGFSSVPLLGSVITSAFTAKNISDLKQQYQDNKISKDKLQEQAGESTIKGAGNILGGITGAALGAALSTGLAASTFGLGAGAAPWIVGGLSIGGDVVGGALADLISKYVLPEKYKKSIGAFVTDTNPPQKELQDFIIKNNRVYPISNKDEVLGMKIGGAVNQYLKSQQPNKIIIREQIKLPLSMAPESLRKPGADGKVPNRIVVREKVRVPLSMAPRILSTPKIQPNIPTRIPNITPPPKTILQTSTSISKGILSQANTLSNMYLRAIADNTAMMVQLFQNNRYSSSNSSISPKSINTKSTASNNKIPIFDNRNGYTNSVYAL